LPPSTPPKGGKTKNFGNSPEFLSLKIESLIQSYTIRFSQIWLLTRYERKINLSILSYSSVPIEKEGNYFLEI
jgi:hypothetical protein